MTAKLALMMSGAVAILSLTATLFFLRFWTQTRDSFFLLFAVAFGLDAVTRVILGLSDISDEAEPLFYIARLVMFGLIIVAIIQKNRPGQAGR